MSLFKKLQMNLLVTAILSILLGLLFILLPGVTMRTIGYILAASLAIAGIIHCVEFFRAWDIANRSNGLSLGILCLLLALFLLLRSELVVSAIPVLLGFAVIASGAAKLQDVAVLLRSRSKAWGYVLAAALLCIVLGVVLIENPFAAARTLIILLGIGLLFSGVTDIAVSLFMDKRLRDIQREVRQVLAKPASEKTEG